MVQAPVEEETLEAARWVARVGRALGRHVPALDGWRVASRPPRVRVETIIDGCPVALDGRPSDAGQRWLATASGAWNITIGDGATPAVHDTLALLQRLLTQGDPGNLRWPVVPPPPRPKRERAVARRTADALRDELHRAAFVAWKAMNSEDLYPHVRTLGLPTGLDEIRAGWARALERRRTGLPPDKLGIYVHIPFCTVECTFCFCGKTSRFGKGAISDYVDNLMADMRGFGPLFGDEPFTSVYFGGGTPSLLRPDLMRALFEALYGSLNVPEGTQVIFEGNPDSLNPAKIEVLADVGRVTRLTIGVQTLDPEAQRRARRFNTKEHVRGAVEAARAAGIPHVNIDLMSGLDGQSMASFQDDVRFVLELGPESLHINPFRPAPWSIFTAGGKTMHAEQARLRDEMLAWGRDALRAHGFGTPMQQGPATTKNAANLQEYDLRRQNSSLLGFGIPARSHSFGAHYYETAVHGDDIATALEEDRVGVRRYSALAVDEIEERHRYLVHNLRSGFPVAEYRDLFGVDPWDVAPAGWQQLHDLGILDVVDGVVVTDVRNVADDLIHRGLLYGDRVLERIEAVWGPDYDRSVDYPGRLGRLLENDASAG